MGLSVYGNTGGFSPPICELWFESSRQNSLIDHSLPGNRLYTQLDGSIAIIPKSIPEVLGERLLRPALDTTYRLSTSSFQLLKNGFLAVDSILSRALNIIPGAAASEACTAETVEKFPICHDGVFELINIINEDPKAITTLTHFFELIDSIKGDPEAISAVTTLYAQGIAECSFKQAKLQYEEDRKEHTAQRTKMEEAIRECQKQNPNYKCISELRELLPELFRIQNCRLWTNGQGSLKWVVSVDDWKSTFFASGSYNFDDYAGKSAVKSRKEIEKGFTDTAECSFKQLYSQYKEIKKSMQHKTED